MTSWTGYIPLSAKFTKWSNTLKQFVNNYRRIVLSVSDHLVTLALKGISSEQNTQKWKDAQARETQVLQT